MCVRPELLAEELAMIAESGDAWVAVCRCLRNDRLLEDRRILPDVTEELRAPPRRNVTLK